MSFSEPRLARSRPHEFQGRICKAAKRPCLRERATKAREVDLSRLKGFRFRFAPKMRSGVTCNWCQTN